MEKMKNLYVDGSVNPDTGNVGWGYVLLNGDKLVHTDCGQLTKDTAKEVRQISGELASTLYGIMFHFSKYPNEPLNIFYDYNGIYFWVCDIFSNGKAWNRNKVATRFYRKRMEEIFRTNDPKLVTFIKVKSHSGVKWNEHVDQLAKKGCGIEI